jgi:hypothetical protein
MFQPKLGLSALALETGAWVQLATGETSDAALLLYLTSHGGASALLALLVWSLLPRRLATPRLAVLGLIWSVSFFIPIFGFCGVILAIFALPLLPRRRGTLDFRAVPLPALDPHEKQDVTSFRQAGVRQFLKNDRAPVAQRLRAVVALGNAPARCPTPCCGSSSTTPPKTCACSPTACSTPARKRSTPPSTPSAASTPPPKMPPSACSPPGAWPACTGS